ncbi:helix-turn-helix transcriptional regulator [uncultured Leptotrichia sp.]|jgi:hypothetical protein|uniref:helix-turn-helix domain-containing protein n=1 Tax=uncultured Leptotrichia sp. TaxID=159271 RepID=UPI0026394BC4|nr:helix-turn-helix transcriptional regulator [uncultured Leptotrichia sp.]
MAVSYDKLWKILIDKKLKKTDLIKNAKISSSALAKLSKNEFVSLSVIDKICFYLDCDISDILHIKNKS